MLLKVYWSIYVSKDFSQEFDKFLGKLQRKENFAFARFSDGELFILQNKTVVLAEKHYVTGDVSGPNIYTKEEQKEFYPEQHSFYRQKLIDSFKHNQKNYFKISCNFNKKNIKPHIKSFLSKILIRELNLKGVNFNLIF